MTGPARNNNKDEHAHVYTYNYINILVVSVEAISEMLAHCNFGDVTIHVLVSLMNIFCVT